MIWTIFNSHKEKISGLNSPFYKCLPIKKSYWKHHCADEKNRHSSQMSTFCSPEPWTVFFANFADTIKGAVSNWEDYSWLSGRAWYKHENSCKWKKWGRREREGFEDVTLLALKMEPSEKECRSPPKVKRVKETASPLQPPGSHFLTFVIVQWHLLWVSELKKNVCY